MDTIRFLSFLQDFASSNISKSVATSPSGTNLPPNNLSQTLSAFEAQLRALMNTSSSEPAAQSTAAGTTDFVVGSQSAPGTAVTGAATAPVSAQNESLREIIAWRREQIDPMLHERVGDLWERQGITDPMNDPKLLAEAQNSYDRAIFRKAQMPGFVANWEGDWRAQQALERQTRLLAIADSVNSSFTVGGGLGHSS